MNEESKPEGNNPSEEAGAQTPEERLEYLDSLAEAKDKTDSERSKNVLDDLGNWDTISAHLDTIVVDPEEAREQALKDEEIRRQMAAERAAKVQEIGYQEVLDDPEEYMYHGANGDPKSIEGQGLMRSPSQDPSQEASIDWWIGTSELHQNADRKYFGGFGNTGRYRAKKSDLESIGFVFEPFSKGAVHAVKVNPVVPPGMLETWDDEIKIWKPLKDIQVEAEDKNNGDGST